MELKGSRLKTFAVCLLLALTLVVGVLITRNEDDPLAAVWGSIGVIFVGLGVIMALIQVWRPLRLILTPDGFRLTGVLGLSLTPWREVESFFVYSEEPVEQADGTRSTGVPPHAAWRLREGSPSEASYVARLNRAGGMPIDGNLPTNLGMKPEPLAELMESWRVRYG